MYHHAYLLCLNSSIALFVNVSMLLGVYPGSLFFLLHSSHDVLLS